MGYHLKLRIAITFYQHYRFFTTKVILYSAVYMLATYVIWIEKMILLVKRYSNTQLQLVNHSN